MYLADYHTHSLCSPDARCSMADMARAAVAAGVQEMCFTDHIETAPIGEIRPSCDWAALKDSFETARREMEGQPIVLRLGAELGGANADFAAAERMMAQAPELDFVIGSVHALSEAYGRRSLYYFDCKSEEEARLAIGDYLDQVLLLAEWGQFDVLGHLTLPLRYLNEKHGMHMTFDGFEERLEAIFRALISNGCGIELNTNRGNEPLPSEKWLRMYRSLGGERITLGSDAHTPEYVGCALRQNQELLKRCGFTRFCCFSCRRPQWHDL
ncbi:histidinol-phosphatase HisJ family protein [Oscillibacter hominis]|uniref:Histidinol-phosphatase n=1 Tax=Oscillibacter hominis TaxID=2763056 RepID=A0A7G9B474_9FIRM|nr:histidinol-phosphatase HisJ family protein [Oscillibacter hominis]QNL44355.1 histidinol-phosphatase HisJ family protein [Oscillibacter hominis]